MAHKYTKDSQLRQNKIHDIRPEIHSVGVGGLELSIISNDKENPEKNYL